MAQVAYHPDGAWCGPKVSESAQQGHEHAHPSGAGVARVAGCSEPVRRRMGPPAAAAAASSSATSSRDPTTAVTTSDRLGQHRGAGGVEDHPARAGRCRAPSSSSALLERHQVAQVVGTAPPARLRAPPQRAQPGAGRVDQHPVERRRPPTAGRVPSAASTPAYAVRAGQRPAHQPGAVRLQLGRQQVGAPLGRQCRQQRRLAAGAGAQVEPPLVPPVDLGPRQRERDQLGTLVLDAGPPLGDRRDLAGVTAVEHHAVRREGGGRAGQLRTGRPSRSRHQHHPGRLVVGGQ